MLRARAAAQTTSTLAATCSFDLRLGRVFRCASRLKPTRQSRRKPVGGRKIAHNPCRFRTSCRTPTVRFGSRPRAAQLPHGAGSHPSHERYWHSVMAHSCATSDTNESLHPEIELQHAATNQPSNQSARNETTTAGMPQREQTSSKPRVSGIKHDFW